MIEIYINALAETYCIIYYYTDSKGINHDRYWFTGNGNTVMSNWQPIPEFDTLL